MFVVRSASDDFWYGFETKTDIITLFNKYGSFKISSNDWEDEPPESLVEIWEGLTLKDAKKIAKCKYEILLYDI